MGTTYKSPIANDYLELRAELGTALFALAALAGEAHAAPELIQTLQNLQAGLREPFLFVAVGEVKAGKSSLLNALFGKEFCRVDVLPATDRVHVFKYGELARDVPLSPGLVERYQPIGFLRDFNVVDTPGTNTIVTEHEAITERFVPQADLIVFVFSVVNPWGASAWRFLELLQRRWFKNVIFVLQQTDLREEREVEVIVQHLRQTAMTRLGQTFPIFPVSAKKAFLSKTSGADKARLWTESQFGPLEDYINETVGTGDTRRAKLQSVDRTAQGILKEFTEQARQGQRTAVADRVELERVRAAVAQARSRGEGQFEGFLRGIDTAFSRCQHQGEHLLRQKLRFWPSFPWAAGRDAQWPTDFQRNIESMLRAAFTRQMEHALDLLEGELRGGWLGLHESMKANFSAEARQRLGTGAVEFGGQRARLVEKIELAMVENLADDRIEKQLRASFAGMASAVRLPVLAAITGTVAVAVLLISRLAPVWVGVAVAAGAAVAAVIGTRIAVGHRRKILDAYRVQMRARQTELGQAVGDLVRHAIETFYQKVSQAYSPLEAFCTVQEESRRPLLERVNTLEKVFQKIAAHL